MKKLLAIVGVSCLATGCMSGTVGVQEAGPQPGSGSEQTSPKIEHENLNSALASAKTLYFESLSSAAGGAASFAGLGFLSMGAQVDTPFEYFFSEPGQASGTVSTWRPVIFSGAEDVAWIQGPTLQILDPGSLSIQEQVGVPPARAYALPIDLSEPRVAGIGSGGALFLSSPGEGITTGKSGFGESSQVFWIEGTKQVAVLDPAAKTVSIFSPGDRSGIQTPATSFAADGFSASPSGNAYVVFSKGKLSEIDSSTGTSRPLDADVSTFIDARWNGEGEVAFVETSGSQSQVDVLSLESGQVVSRFPISGVSPNQVCPAWVSGNLFFASANPASENPEGSSVIWQGHVDGSETQFATAQSSDRQYVCPKGASQ